jgi:5-methyltetrahydrofolate--homocysteine methyltransferase
VEATKLLDDAKACLSDGIKNGWFHPTYVYGIFSANAVGDDIEIYDETTHQVLHRSIGLRQQIEKTSGQFNLCLSDYIAPKESGIADYIGCFAVTSGDVTAVCKQFEAAHDDYTSIMIKAVADRLAEALAEWLHERVRLTHWGYDKTPLKNEELIAEKYKGIRPAPGYPACPDHYEKLGIFNVLNATDRIGVSLTESLAMHPASSVSGWYFAHPSAKYFGITAILEDQFLSVCERRNVNKDEHISWFPFMKK